MKHRRATASFALAAALLVSSSSFAAGASGIVRFTGMLVEPPCSFTVDSADAQHARMRPDCPRPATGQVAFVDAATLRTVATTSFSQGSRTIVVPERAGTAHAPLIAVVTYQ